MSAVQISTNVEFIQVDTSTRGGRILLPSTTATAGRILTFKDTTGFFGTNPLLLSTNGLDRFENNASLKTLRDPFGYLTLASDGVSKWYFLDGTSLNSYTINSVRNTVQTSTFSISTTAFTVSTLSFQDQILNTVSSVYSRSTLLYLGSNVIAGSMVGPTLFLRPSPQTFQPNQIANLAVWYDAADPTVFSLVDNTVRTWRDKSSNQFHFSNGVYAPQTYPFLTSNFNGTFRTVQTFSGIPGVLQRANISRTSLQGATGTTWFVVMSYNSGIVILQHADPRLISLENSNRFDYGNPNVVFNLPTGFTYSPPQITTFTVNSAGASLQMYQTGNLLMNCNANIIATNYATNLTLFGLADNTANIPSYASVSEIIAYNTFLTTAQRQQVEGYLAWKWGLVGGLPFNHPYKQVPV